MGMNRRGLSTARGCKAGRCGGIGQVFGTHLPGGVHAVYTTGIVQWRNRRERARARGGSSGCGAAARRAEMAGGSMALLLFAALLSMVANAGAKQQPNLVLYLTGAPADRCDVQEPGGFHAAVEDHRCRCSAQTTRTSSSTQRTPRTCPRCEFLCRSRGRLLTAIGGALQPPDGKLRGPMALPAAGDAHSPRGPRSASLARAAWARMQGGWGVSHLMPASSPHRPTCPDPPQPPGRHHH